MENLIHKKREFVVSQIEKSFDNDIEKARHGRYEDTAENRKLNRVGQEYGQAAKENEPAVEKRGKGEEPKSVGDLVKQQATEASTEALKRAAADDKAKPELREAAKKELANRGGEDKGSERKGEGDESLIDENGKENKNHPKIKRLYELDKKMDDDNETVTQEEFDEFNSLLDELRTQRINHKIKSAKQSSKKDASIKFDLLEWSSRSSDDTLKHVSEDESVEPDLRVAAEREIDRRKNGIVIGKGVIGGMGSYKKEENQSNEDDEERDFPSDAVAKRYKLGKKEIDSWAELAEDKDANGLPSVMDGVGYELVDHDKDLKDLADQGYGEDSKIFKRMFLEKFADKMSEHNDAISSAVDKYGLKTVKAYMMENSETVSDKELNHIINQALESKTKSDNDSKKGEDESWIDKHGNEKHNHPKIKRMDELFMKMNYGGGLTEEEYKEHRELMDELHRQKTNNKNWMKRHASPEEYAKKFGGGKDTVKKSINEDISSVSQAEEILHGISKSNDFDEIMD